MSSFFDLVSYQTATGLLDNNFPSEGDQYYKLRRELLHTIQNQAWTLIPPFTNWLEANRVFFKLSDPLSYTIGNITFSLSPGVIYTMDPKEAQIVHDTADMSSIVYTPSTMAAWQGGGSLDIFYW